MKLSNLRLVVTLVLLVSLSTFAQNFNIRGQLRDAEKNTPLEAATVYLETLKDSSLVTYTITNSKGEFSLIGDTYAKKLNLLISSVGYETYKRELSITKEQLDIGIVKLNFSVESLDEVILKSRAPITVKKDTLEFNVASFKTKKDANVEDLLKELPGVEVDDEGNIKVNGKPVNKILVNGKPFFGDDPTIATRNLPKDIVDKIQVTDTKSDSEAFAGDKGDGENKTINITIQEDKNKGIFGRVAAGRGTDDRYEYAGIINYFNNDRRLSALSGGNNINSPGFSFGEIRKMFGGGRSVWVNDNGGFGIDGRNFGGGVGITTSSNTGLNFTDDLGKKASLTADYFYAGSESENERIADRENILADSRFFTTSSSFSKATTNAHDGNIKLDIKADTTLLINNNTNFKLFKTSNDFQSLDNSRDETGDLINTSSLLSKDEREENSLKNDFSITKRFGDRGAYVRANMTNEVTRNEGDRLINSETEIFGDNPDTILRDQNTLISGAYNSIFSQFTYRYPILSNKLFVDLRYSYRYDFRENQESTFDFDELNQTYTLFNESLSTDFEFKNTRRTPGISFSYRDKKLSLSFGGGHVNRKLENKDNLRNLTFDKSFEAVELNGYFRYKVSQSASLYSGYSLRNDAPQINQLQPFQDVSNPLNIVTGNPNLEPSNSHNVYAGYNDYNFLKKSGFYSYFNASVTNDKVVPRTIVDENLIRNTTYDNVDGDYRINGSFSKSKSFKLDSLRTLKLGVGAYGNLARVVNFNNNIQYASKTTSITPNFDLTFDWKNVFQFRPSYSISFTNTTYDIEEFEGRKFARHALRLRTTTNVPENLEWSNDMQFNYNPDVAPGFQKSSWFWNTTVAYTILKKKATVTLKIYDLLNQNTNARRTATDNYIEDVESTVLRQYFMLSLSYKFNSLGKKGEIEEHSFF